MRKTARTLVVGLAALLGLTFAGTAPAAFTPKLVVTGASQAPAGAGVRIKFTVPQNDDPTAKVTFYVPQGYGLSIAGATGTRLGTAAAAVLAIDQGAVIPVTGTVETANPADFTAQAIGCTGTATHTQVWALRLAPAGAPLIVPVFVDAISAGPLAAFASAQLVICLPPPDVPVGTPGRAPLGAKLISADFTSNAVTNPTAPGSYRWRATVTAYTPTKGTPNAASTVEVQSPVNLPSQATLTAKVTKGRLAKTRVVTYGGTFLANARPLTGGTVEVLRGSTTAMLTTKVKTFTIGGRGTFASTLTIRQGVKALPLILIARGSTVDQTLGAAGCVATFTPALSPFAIPCTDATIGAVSITTRVVKVTIPAAPKKKSR